ncbi:MAG: hypothetical protein ABEN55_23115 [Bradymonadaceae bacterium]
MNYDAEKGRYREQAAEQVWMAGQTLTIETAGAEVPSFAVDIQPLWGVVLEAPALPKQGDKMVVDIGSDLPVRWTTDMVEDGDIFTAKLTAKTSNDSSYALACDWDATAGEGSVPASLLGRFDETEGTGQYDFTVARTRSTSAGDVDVAIEVRSEVDDEPGATTDGRGKARFETQ